MFIASFNGVVNHPATPLNPERLAELIQKLEETTTPFKPVKDKPGSNRLTHAEMLELWWAGRQVVPGCLAVYRNEELSTAARIDALGLLVNNLAGMCRPADPAVLRAVLDAMDDPSPPIRRAVQQNLWYHCELYTVKNGQWVPGTRHPVRNCFNHKVFPIVHSKIVASVGDKDDETATLAAENLMRYMQVGVGIDVLLENIRRDCPPLQAKIVMSLSYVGLEDPRSLEAVEKVIAESKDSKTQSVAIYSLHRFGKASTATIKNIVSCMKQEREAGKTLCVRGAATEALIMLYHKRKIGTTIDVAEEELLLLMKDRNKYRDRDLQEVKVRANELLNKIR
jgi:hypothetical protein